MADETVAPAAWLNEPQHRRLSVVLRSLERTLGEVEELVQGSAQLRLTRYTSDFAPEEARAILSITNLVRSRVAELTERFQVEPDERSARRAIAARIALEWEALEDSRPDKLRRYGRVDPRLDGVLGPEVDRLIALMRELAAIVERPAPPAAGGERRGTSDTEPSA